MTLMLVSFLLSDYEFNSRQLTLTVQKGCSGALVVDAETAEVYGQVVARNPLGELYVVAMMEIAEQIKEAFETTSLSLTPPSPQAANGRRPRYDNPHTLDITQTTYPWVIANPPPRRSRRFEEQQYQMPTSPPRKEPVYLSRQPKKVRSPDKLHNTASACTSGLVHLVSMFFFLFLCLPLFIGMYQGVYDFKVKERSSSYL